METGEDDIKLAKFFLEKAVQDMDSAETLLKKRNYADSVYHSQQTAEKSAKALLILEGRFVRDHIVSPVLGEIMNRTGLGGKVLEDLMFLEEHRTKSRYPEPLGMKIWNPLEEYTRDIAEEALEKARAVLHAVGRVLKERHGMEA